MDVIIQKYDFKKGSEKVAEKMEEELCDWKNEKMEDVADKKMALKTLGVVQTKVCIADFPTIESHSGTMAKQAFSSLSELISHVISEEKAKPADFHTPLLDFLMKLISSGPGTTHLELMEDVFGVYDVEFKEYFQSLKGDHVRKVLALCKKEYKPKEKISNEHYASAVESGMRNVLSDGFTEEQAEQHRADFLDAYLYFEYGFIDRKEEERKLMADLGYMLYLQLDSEPFKGAKDKAVYVGFLNRMKEVILAKSYPADDEAVEKVESGLSSLFGAMKEQGNLKDLYEELMDFAAAIFTEKAGKPVHKLIDAVGYYFYHVDEAHVKGNAKMFEGICTKLTQIVEKNKDLSLMAMKFADAIISEVLVKNMSNSANHVVLLINLIKALVQVPLKTTLDGAIDALREKEKALKWKEHIPAAKDIFISVSKVKVPEGEDQEEILGKYKDFTEYFLDQVKKARIQEQFIEGQVQFALGVLESKNEPLYDMAQEIADRTEFDAKKNKGLVMDVFTRIDRALKDDSYPWLDNIDLASLASQLVSNAIQGVKNGNMLDEKDYKVLISILRTVTVKDFIHPDTGEAGSVFYRIFTTLATNVYQKLDSMNELGWAEPSFGNVIALLDHELEDVRDMASMQLDIVGRKGGDLLAPYMDKMLESFLEHEKYSLLVSITGAYPAKPGPVNKQFQKLMTYHDTGDPSVKSYIIQLYAEVAKLHPEQFTEENLKTLWKEAKEDEGSTVQILMIMEDVAKKYPDRVGVMLPQLMADSKKLISYAQPSLINVLKQVGIRSEKHAAPIIDYYAKTLEGPEEQTLFLCTLDGLRNVGGKHLPLLTKHKALFERVHKTATIQYTKDGCTGLIDIIEGRSLATLSDDIKETQEDVEELDTKVTKTEKQVKVVSKEVTKQKKEIKTVKKDVKAQGKKIEDLEETVDDTVAKVEEIDSKTLSHAPFWSRDVSKILNPKDEHDWRLLSSRLGYSNDDIRGWAQQHDPCMAMLNEWYATRKTSEATFAVMTALQEMNRMDAAAIVENGMKMAETVVEDEPFEYATPPAVFISYQWGIQNEVKLLKQHLEMAGYECWMDIGQMGGGDKLFEKIDQGIRASKVIISCVTEKYAKSPNCNREVNLSVSLGRPILPLLMEKQTWPPAGSMGPIFSEYLFIRFFTRPGEETGDQRYWSAAKFQELLMQLNYNGIVPDEGKVEKEYKNWWTPVVEEIKIEKKKGGGKAEQTQAKAAENAEIAAVSPDVFISYQWGKQKQIMLLYRRLTGLGYSCWMDIHQMGGGDSLYDKIDRGVRGCKLVLSCITTKYSLSANCRREVSLADALKKPIVPLLLEQITWPPAGPMSMVFTQLLYINFSKDEKLQEKWAGKEFDELIGKIEANVLALPAADKNTTTKNDSKPHQKTTTPSNGNAAKQPTSNETKSSPATTKPHKNTGKPPPSQANTPQSTGSRTSPTTDKPKPKTAAQSVPEKKENTRQDPPPSKPAQSTPEPQKAKSCTLL